MTAVTLIVRYALTEMMVRNKRPILARKVRHRPQGITTGKYEYVTMHLYCNEPRQPQL